MLQWGSDVSRDQIVVTVESEIAREGNEVFLILCVGIEKHTGASSSGTFTLQLHRLLILCPSMM